MSEQSSLFQLERPSETFDPTWAADRKQKGMTQAAEKRKEILDEARDLARLIASSNTDWTCNADDVQDALIKLGHKPSELGNAAGSIFQRSEWECIGWKASTRASSNGRAIRMWRLR